MWTFEQSNLVLVTSFGGRVFNIASDRVASSTPFRAPACTSLRRRELGLRHSWEPVFITALTARGAVLRLHTSVGEDVLITVQGDVGFGRVSVFDHSPGDPSCLQDGSGDEWVADLVLTPVELTTVVQDDRVLLFGAQKRKHTPFALVVYLRFKSYLTSTAAVVSGVGGTSRVTFHHPGLHALNDIRRLYPD